MARAATHRTTRRRRADQGGPVRGHTKPVGIGLVLLTLMLTALGDPATAREESEAPALRDDVVRVWHEPEAIVAGDQFEGHIQLTEDTNVTAVYYQVCDIGAIACIIAPRPATSAGDGQWAFDTADFSIDGGQAHWEGRIGVQWFLSTNGLENATEFPHGTPLTDPSCEGLENAIRCYETHYFAFDVPAAPDQDAPLPVWVLVAALAVVLWTRR